VHGAGQLVAGRRRDGSLTLPDAAARPRWPGRPL